MFGVPMVHVVTAITTLSHRRNTLMKKLVVFLTFCVSLLILYFFGDRVPYLNLVYLDVVKFLSLLLLFLLGHHSKFAKNSICLTFFIFFVAGFFNKQYEPVYLGFAFLFLDQNFFITLADKLKFEKKYLVKIYNDSFLLLASLFIVISVLIAYSAVFNSYFEGDEWYFLRRATPKLESSVWYVQGFMSAFFNRDTTYPHVIPVADNYQYAQFKLFGLHFEYYVLASLMFHSINSILVFYLLFQLTNSRRASLASGLLFAVTATHAQGVTWVSATINVEPALAFGLLSLIFFKKYLNALSVKKRNSIFSFNYSFISMFFLLLSLWSKETSVMFLVMLPLLYIVDQKKSLLNFLLEVKSYSAVFLLFIFTQALRIFDTSASGSLSLVGYTPWSYKAVFLWEKYEISLLLFRLFSFSLKGLAQSIFSSSYLLSLGVWLTDMQFPYFNLEKSVRGTNYLMFIQSAMPELISYILGLGVLTVLILLMKKSQYSIIIKTFSVVYISALVPIVMITVKFPWWGYSSIIDERHFYHLTFITVFFQICCLLYLAKSLFNSKSTQNFFFWVLLSLIFYFNISSLHERILNQQETTLMSDRKLIVNTLQNDIVPVPKKLIIYTTSNKSFYGFGQWMLPFQTAFSHMLPVLFSKVYNPHGVDYPASFFTDEYLAGSKDGLVTQGFHEDGDYGLGYFLELKPLIKFLEHNGYDESLVYAYDYDGDTHTFENQTNDIRKEIATLLGSRSKFKNWLRVGSLENMLSFQVNPSWRFDEYDSGYKIFDGNGYLIATIEIFDNDLNQQFSLFVTNYIKTTYPNTEKTYLTKTFPLDLDTERLIYVPEDEVDSWFFVAGNNLKFYKMKVFQKDIFEEMLRTFEFIDNDYDVISI